MVEEGRCSLCHEVVQDAAGDWTVQPVALTAKWLPKAAFDHQAHRPFACESCHEAAAASKVATDVLIPGIKTCRECHGGARARPPAVASDCVSCHSFHRADQGLIGLVARESP